MWDIIMDQKDPLKVTNNTRDLRFEGVSIQKTNDYYKNL